MRRSKMIVAACLVLALGATGCDDDDDVIIDPVTQGVAAATQGVVTGVNAVTALAFAFAPAVPLQTGALGTTCPEPIDISAETCTGGSGTATFCDDPAFIDLAGCNVAGVGVLDGAPAVFPSGINEVTVNLLVDGSTSIFGTLALPEIAAAGGPTCFVFDYDLQVSNGSSSTIAGIIEGCDDGSVTSPLGPAFVTIAELNLSMVFFFQGNSATVDVFDLSTQELLAFCTVSPLDGVPSCEAPITKG